MLKTFAQANARKSRLGVADDNIVSGLNGIQRVEVLAEDEAVLVTAREAFVDEGYVDRSDDGPSEPQDVARRPGDRWMVYGPVRECACVCVCTCMYVYVAILVADSSLVPQHSVSSHRQW